MDKTIVTDLRTYVVDNLGKNGIFRQSFSTKIDSTVALENSQFVLQPGEEKVIANVERVLQLRTDQPVALTITQTGEVIVTPEEPEVPEYYTATIAASNFVAGQLIEITVTDLDIPLSVQEVRVVVFNVTTGETEQLMLQKVSAHTYSGQQLTSFNGEATNFDTVLNCSHNDAIHILYQDAKDASGAAQTIVKLVRASSPYQDTELQVNSYLHVGKPVAILMIDADIDTPTYPCLVRNVTTGEEENILLNRIAPNTYTYSLPTTLNNGNVVSNDNVLQVAVDDVITITVFDENSVSTPIKVRTVEVREMIYTNGILSMPTSVIPDSNVTITFFDYDLAGSNYVDLPVSNVRTGEFEYVRCNETVHGSGTFIGILTLTSDVTKNITGDGLLYVMPNDSISAVYVDVTSPNASSNVIRFESFVVSVTPIPEPEPEEPEPDDDDEDVDEGFTEQSIQLISNGAFVFGGSFNGKITVKALQKPVRCELLFV